jgi:hypothetical protein
MTGCQLTMTIESTDSAGVPPELATVIESSDFPAAYAAARGCWFSPAELQRCRAAGGCVRPVRLRAAPDCDLPRFTLAPVGGMARTGVCPEPARQPSTVTGAATTPPVSVRRDRS